MTNIIIRKVKEVFDFFFGVISIVWHLFCTMVRVFIRRKSMRPEPTDRTPRILGTGRADGTYRYTQDFLADKLVEQYPHLSAEEHETIRDVFRKTGTKSCTSCWSEEFLFKNVGKTAWVEHVRKAHIKMGGEAMEKVKFYRFVCSMLCHTSNVSTNSQHFLLS